MRLTASTRERSAREGLNRKTQRRHRHLWSHSPSERARHKERSSFSGGTQRPRRGRRQTLPHRSLFLHSPPPPPPPLKEIERFTQQELFERADGRTDGRRGAAPFYLVKPTKCSFDDAVPANFSTKRRDGRADRSTAVHAELGSRSSHLRAFLSKAE